MPGIVPILEAQEGDCVSVRGDVIEMNFYQTDESADPVYAILAIRNYDKLYMVKLYPIVFNKAFEHIRESVSVLVAGVLQKLPDDSMSILALEIDSWDHYISLRLADPFNKLAI
jgi:hypothetical protein